jgi:cytochrome c peroxidase
MPTKRMPSKRWISLVILVYCASASAAPGEFRLRLPVGLSEQALNIPQDNPLVEEKVDLGWQLFFDRRLSADETIACATCHVPARGFSDGQPRSTALNEQKLGRNTPTIVNRAFGSSYFWDGRASSLEETILLILRAHLGNSDEAIVQKLSSIRGYAERFRRVFGASVTMDGIGKSLAAFVRTIFSGNSPFDRFEAGDRTALSLQAQRGFKLFRGKANCTTCHVGFNFTDEQFHNTGVGLYNPDPDLGRYAVTNRDEDKGAFKTPTLRDLAQTAPYMHDGSLETLEKVVQFYNRGGIKNPYLAKELTPLHLTPQEQADLLAFLNSLTGAWVNTPAPTPPH